MRLVTAMLLLAACGRPDPVATTAAKQETCSECHERLHPGLLADHNASPHASIPLTCDDCHGTDHDEIFARKGAVPPTTCARCHPDAYKAFARSRHGRRLKDGKLDALLEETMVATGGCTSTNGCHTIQTAYEDGSVGRCGACHVTHAFRNAEARDPRICTACHEGTDHPQYRAWQRSAHSFASPSGDGLVADCVKCHSTHDVSDAVTHGLPPLQTSKPVDAVPAADPEKFASARATMLKRCLECHGKRFARAALERGDWWRNQGALALDTAARIVRELERDGLIDPAPATRARNRVAGHALRLGGAQIFDQTMSLPERIYYEMHFLHYPALWRAVYHTDPERVTWEANDKLKSALDRLRAIDRNLRRATGAPKETWTEQTTR